MRQTNAISHSHNEVIKENDCSHSLPMKQRRDRELRLLLTLLMTLCSSCETVIVNIRNFNEFAQKIYMTSAAYVLVDYR